MFACCKMSYFLFVKSPEIEREGEKWNVKKKKTQKE